MPSEPDDLDIPSERAEADEYTWDLTAIYESSDHWDNGVERVHETLDKLESLEGGVIESPEGLAKALTLRTDLHAEFEQLWLYATLRNHIEQDDSENEARLERYRELESTVRQRTGVLRSAVQDLTATELKRYIAEKEALQPYEFYFHDLHRQRTHTLPEQQETILAELGETLKAPNRMLSSISEDVDVDLPEIELSTSERATVSDPEHFEHASRDVRERAYKGFYEANSRHRNTRAQALSERFRTKAKVADLRNYDSPREAALDQEAWLSMGRRLNFEPAIHDAVLEAVRDHLDQYHRYLRARQDLLGIDELRPWDLEVPLIPGEPPIMSYEEATSHIVTAVEPLGPAYQHRLESYLDRRCVDVYSRESKIGWRGYCFTAPGTDPYMLLNYDGKLRTVFDFAHELGHAMQMLLGSEQQPSYYSVLDRPAEEVPSYVHELLLVEHLRDQISDDEFQQQLLSFITTRLHKYLYEFALRMGFKHDAYDRVAEENAIEADEFDALVAEYVDEFRAPVVYDEYKGREWMRRSYGRRPYHSYQYVIGTIGAATVKARLDNGSLTGEEYRKFLGTGSSEPAVDLLHSLGIDFRTREPMDQATELLDDMVGALPRPSD